MKFGKILIVVLLSILIGLIYFNSKSYDQYKRTISAEELIIEEDNVTIKSPMINLPAGKYSLAIYYEPKEVKAGIEVKSIRNSYFLDSSDRMLLSGIGKDKIVFRISETISELQVHILLEEMETIEIQKIVIECLEGKANTNDAEATFIVIIFIVGLLWYFRKQANLWLIFIIIFIVSLPLFVPYLQYGDDLIFHLARIMGISSSLEAGMFPVRIHTDLFGGYGYDVSVFYPEIFLYIPAILHLMGVSLVKSWQIFLFIINAATAFLMYFSVKGIFKSSKTALYASILYTSSIYRLCDVFVRSALGETIALTFLPLVLYGMYEIIVGEKRKWWCLVIAFTGVFQSHLLTVIPVALLCIIAVLVYYRKILSEKRLFTIFKVIIMSILVNIWWLIPYLDYTRQGISAGATQSMTNERALYLPQILSGFSDPLSYINFVGERMSGNPLALGIPILAGLTFYIYLRAKYQETEKFVLAMGITGLIFVFMSTYYFPWDTLMKIPFLFEKLSFLQFPWRLLAFAILFLSIVSAVGYSNMIKDEKLGISIVMIICFISTTHLLDIYAREEIYFRKGETVNTYLKQNEYLYNGTDKDMLISGNIKTSSPNIQVTNFVKDGLQISTEWSAEDQGSIDFPLLYYPGYHVTSKTANLTVTKGENNVVSVAVPDNSEGQMKLWFEEPLLWKVANIISVLSILSFLFFKIYLNTSKIKSDQAKE